MKLIRVTSSIVESCPNPIQQIVQLLYTSTMNLELFLLLFTVSGGSAAVLILPSNLMQKEGENIVVNCTVGPGETRLDFQLLVNGVEFAQTGRNVRSGSTDTGTFFEYGPLRRSDNGATFVCTAQGMSSSESTLVVACTFFGQTICAQHAYVAFIVYYYIIMYLLHDEGIHQLM